MLGQRARPVRRAGTGKPAPETVHGVPSPTQHMELDRRGAELLFRVLTERKEKNSVAFASNESFGGEVGRRRGAPGWGPFPTAPSRTVRAPFNAYRSPVTSSPG